MSAPRKFIVKDNLHIKVEKHFLVMTKILSHGKWLRKIGIGTKIRKEIDTPRLAVLDTVAEYEEDFEEDFEDD